MAITSSTDICNLSLDMLHAGTVQDVENPTTATEELLERWYNQTRRKLLREHPWNFATKRTILAASATAPAFQYTSAFPVPSDFIRMLSLQTDESASISGESYTIENGISCTMTMQVHCVFCMFMTFRM